MNCWRIVKIAEEVREILKGKGLKCSLVNARFVKPIDTDYLKEAAENHRLFVTMEENVESGGYGEKVRKFVDDLRLDVNVLTIAIPDQFVTHGSVDRLRTELGIDAKSIAERVLGEINR